MTRLVTKSICDSAHRLGQRFHVRELAFELARPPLPVRQLLVLGLEAPQLFRHVDLSRDLLADVADRLERHHGRLQHRAHPFGNLPARALERAVVEAAQEQQTEAEEHQKRQHGAHVTGPRRRIAAPCQIQFVVSQSPHASGRMTP